MASAFTGAACDNCGVSQYVPVGGEVRILVPPGDGTNLGHTAYGITKPHLGQVIFRVEDGGIMRVPPEDVAWVLSCIAGSKLA